MGSTILFNLNNYFRIDFPLSLPSQIHRAQWSRPWIMKPKRPIWGTRRHHLLVIRPSLNLLYLLNGDYGALLWGVCCVCVCVCKRMCMSTFDLLRRVPSTCKYSIVPYTEPSITPPPTSITFFLPFLNTFSNLWQSHSATHYLALPWLDVLWEACAGGRRKRVNDRAANVKRMRKAGDKGRYEEAKRSLPLNLFQTVSKRK